MKEKNIQEEGISDAELLIKNYGKKPHEACRDMLNHKLEEERNKFKCLKRLSREDRLSGRER